MLFLLMLIFSVVSFTEGEIVLSLIKPMFFLSLMVLVFLLARQWSHALILMMLLEFFSLMTFFLWALFIASVKGMGLIFFFSVLMVCEACLGVSLVVSLARAQGNENFVF